LGRFRFCSGTLSLKGGSRAHTWAVPQHKEIIVASKKNSFLPTSPYLTRVFREWIHDHLDHEERGREVIRGPAGYAPYFNRTFTYEIYYNGIYFYEIFFYGSILLETVYTSP
jgi:hypothetical protein